MALFHLHITQPDRQFFRLKEDICALLDKCWGYLQPNRTRSATWTNSVSASLSTQAKLFLSGQATMGQLGYWALKKVEPPSKPTKRGKQELPASHSTPSSVRKQAQSSASASPAGTPLRSATSTPVPAASKPPTASSVSKSFSAVIGASTTTPPQQYKRSTVMAAVSASAPAALDAPAEPSVPLKRQRSRPPSDKSRSSDESDSESSGTDQECTTPSRPRKRQMSQHGHQSISPPPPAPPTQSTTLIATGPPRARQKRVPQLSIQRQFEIKSRLDVMPSSWLTPSLAQFRRKLHLQAEKRVLGLRLFDLDAWMNRYARVRQPAPTPMTLPPDAKARVCLPDGSWRILSLPDMSSNQVLDRFRKSAKQIATPYDRSLRSKLYGNPMLRDTLTVFEDRISPYTGKRLRPYIMRDYGSRPPRKAMLETISAMQEAPNHLGTDVTPAIRVKDLSPIDYVYLHDMHIDAVNDALAHMFWPSIDVSENLLFPDYSVVALYKRLVVGCAFMTPEGYITYIMVVPGWDGCGIASRMLFHLIEARSASLDVTLHVSANNRAMLLYQKFGFKPEGFIVGFYDKYLASNSQACKNAVFTRLRLR
ncbi:hypothetical protein BC831DRAFT_397374 [Entophlyctis helioformis]|nr:hypothetical protein BC831DRAFT_397374 [Entophlyctis helioformis]